TAGKRRVLDGSRSLMTALKSAVSVRRSGSELWKSRRFSAARRRSPVFFASGQGSASLASGFFFCFFCFASSWAIATSTVTSNRTRSVGTNRARSPNARAPSRRARGTAAGAGPLDGGRHLVEVRIGQLQIRRRQPSVDLRGPARAHDRPRHL